MRLFHDDMNWPHKLKPATADVLAIIEKFSLTGSKKGWYGSLRQLAEMCPTDISHTLASKAIRELLELGLIVEPQKGVYFVTKRDTDVTNHDNLVTERDTFVTERDKSTPLNNPPININNNKQNDKTKTPAPTRKEVSEFKMKNNFDIFWAYHNPPKNLRYNKRQCRWLWEDVLDYSVRDQIIDQLMHLAADNRLADERNPYYYLRSFAPREPHNWNGDPSIDSKTRTRLLSAKYHDQFGMYTVEHVLLFGLPVAPDARPLLDAYIAYYHNNHDKKPVTYKVL